GNSTSDSPVIGVTAANHVIVAFRSFATNLMSSITDTNFTGDIFVRDVTTWTTFLVSSDTTGLATANAQSFGPVISRDGSTVAFRTSATNLLTGVNDNNGTTDLYLYNVASPGKTLLSAEVPDASTGNNTST